LSDVRGAANFFGNLTVHQSVLVDGSGKYV